MAAVENLCRRALVLSRGFYLKVLRAHLDIMNDHFSRASDGSYAWARRGVSARAQADEELATQIAAAHARTWSSLSTLHGPAISTGESPPIRMPATSTTGPCAETRGCGVFGIATKYGEAVLAEAGPGGAHDRRTRGSTARAASLGADMEPR